MPASNDVEPLAVPARGRGDDRAQSVPGGAVPRRLGGRRTMAGCRGRPGAIEIAASGRRRAAHHVVAENEAQPARQVDARLAGALTFRAARRYPLVIDRYVVGTDHAALAVEHRPHPIGRAVQHVHAGAVASRAEAGVGAVDIS